MYHCSRYTYPKDMCFWRLNCRGKLDAFVDHLLCCPHRLGHTSQPHRNGALEFGEEGGVRSEGRIQTSQQDYGAARQNVV